MIKTACSLVGKVNYFWAGNPMSSAGYPLGQVRKSGRTAAPPPHLPPLWLDCSGFVDWVFYNITEGEYIIGHGEVPPASTNTAPI